MQQHSIVRQYEGHPITYRDDGWFNATEAAAKYGKSPYEWLRLPDTTAYLAALERKYGEIPYSTTKRGSGGGTWLHPKLAVRFAQWLDTDFSVWCDEQIDSIIRDKHDWTRLRHMSVASAKFLHATIKEAKEEDGKTAKDHHYMCEHRLVNSLLTGRFEGINRDTLHGWQLDFIGHFEMRDGALLLKGKSYQERKTILTAEAATWMKLNQHRIEASNDPGLLAA